MPQHELEVVLANEERKLKEISKILDASLLPGLTTDIVTLRLTKEQVAMLMAAIEQILET